MSEQEKHEAIGKAVTEYGSVRGEPALCSEQADQLSETRRFVCAYFRKPQGGTDRGWVHRGNPTGTIISSLPEKAAMEKLASAAITAGRMIGYW